MNVLTPSPNLQKLLKDVEIYSDFTTVRNDDEWVDTITDSGTVTVSDGVNGVLTLTPSDCTVADNDEAYVASARELFLYGTNREIYLRAKLRYTEVTATIASIAFGAQNAVGANSIVDTTGEVKVTGSTLAIYKVDGGDEFKVASASNGTATTTTTNRAAAAATDYDLLIHCRDWDGVSMQVSFYVGAWPAAPTILRDTNNREIYHTVAIASATEMALFAGIKLGAITNNDTLLLDWVYGAQSRV